MSRTVLSLLACAGLCTVAVAQPQVRLRYASFDPLVSVPHVPDWLRAEPDCRVWLIQFRTTPSETMRSRVRSHHGRVLHFATDHTYVVEANSEAAAAIGADPDVRWIGPYHPAYRVCPEELSRLASRRAADSVRYSIETFDGTAQAVVANAAARAGGIVDSAPSGSRRLEATLTREQLVRLLHLNEVNFVDPAGPPGADMDIVRQMVGAVPVLSAAGFTGRGVRGEVFDTEIDVNHPAFQNPPPLLHFPLTGGPSHGTGVYGIIFGNGAGNASGTGLLPDREQGIFCPYNVASTFGGPVSNRDLIAQLVNPGGPFRAVFQSRAVGAPQVANYTTISAAMDAAAFEFDFLICQSMGDTGNQLSRPESWGKNIVGCGGVTHQNTVSHSDDAGGPNIQASDGRYKPDMVAPRDNVTSTWPGSLYATFGGVSASTAIMSGCFGLVMQMWHEGVWPDFGGGVSVFADRPHLSTVRALVINSAHQYDWTGTGPNIPRGSQGWGVPDLAALYNIRSKTAVLNETDPILPQQTKTYSVYVHAGEPALKVTMVYLDPAGNPAAAQARINDLSLRVVSPAQTAYWGNSGLRNSIWSAPGGAANTVDVVENVFIQNPSPGAWTVEVIGSEIVQDARVETPEVDADFALVASGVSCYANCDASSGTPLLTANDFQCFLNRFASGDLYANCDGSTGSPLLTANDFQCFLNRYAGPCPSW